MTAGVPVLIAAALALNWIVVRDAHILRRRDSVNVADAYARACLSAAGAVALGLLLAHVVMALCRDTFDLLGGTAWLPSRFGRRVEVDIVWLALGCVFADVLALLFARLRLGRWPFGEPPEAS